METAPPNMTPNISVTNSQITLPFSTKPSLRTLYVLLIISLKKLLPPDF
jgi:hypothetical protein